MAASENEVTLRFPDLYFLYIPWVDNSPAIPIYLIFSPPAANLPQPNSNTNKNNKSISSDSEDKLNPPPSSSKQSPTPSPLPISKENSTPQSQQRSARLETKSMPDYYNRRRISTAKTNSSVPLGSPHSKATQMLYNYVFSNLINLFPEALSG